MITIVPRASVFVVETMKTVKWVFHLTITILPRILIFVGRNVKIVKWDALFKRIDFMYLTFLNIESHLTLFTFSMVFIRWRGHIDIVKWNL